MDGSKRSGHGNAYFTGLGNNKRIVFFDNLVNSLDDEELEAVDRRERNDEDRLWQQKGER